MAGWKSIATPAAVGLVLLLAGCQHIPYYDESLGWFSRSEYDPEVKAIEEETSPPGELQAPTTQGRTTFLRDERGGYVSTDSPPGVTVWLGGTQAVGMSATDGGVSLVDASGGSGAGTAAPLVGIRSSVGPSATWRSPRGTP
jgi:hypothetical protein